MAIRGARARIAAYLLALTLAAVLVHGYHVGLEDQAIYLPAIERDLDPSLFPHDAQIFLAQTDPTLFDEAVARTVRVTHLSIEWTLLLWHLASIFLILGAGWRILRRCFPSRRAAAAGTALLASLLTLSVAGTALYLADQYLHPRAPATALLLLFLVDVLDRRLWRAALWLVPAALLHVQMAVYAVVLAVFLLLPEHWLPHKWLHPQAAPAAMLLFFPLQSLFQPSSEAWKEAVRAHGYLYLLRWEWYEWLGIIAPPLLLFWFARVGERRNLLRLADVCRRVACFGAFVVLLGVAITIPPQLERLVVYQPLRGFHLVYLFLVLLSGGLLGEFALLRKPLRWIVLLAPLCGVMFYAQRSLLASSAHIEWPGAAPRNPWLQAFRWVRDHAPKQAYFALDPRYLERPHEDFHGFRAFAERGMMDDAVKDSGVVQLFPSLADDWQRQVHARDRWKDFTPDDFRRLHRDFGADWVVLENTHPAAGSLACPYRNSFVRVCRIE